MLIGWACAVAATVLNSAGLLESDATRRVTRGRWLVTRPLYLGGLVTDGLGWAATVVALRYLPVCPPCGSLARVTAILLVTEVTVPGLAGIVLLGDSVRPGGGRRWAPGSSWRSPGSSCSPAPRRTGLHHCRREERAGLGPGGSARSIRPIGARWDGRPRRLGGCCSPRPRPGPTPRSSGCARTWATCAATSRPRPRRSAAASGPRTPRSRSSTSPATPRAATRCCPVAPRRQPDLAVRPLRAGRPPRRVGRRGPGPAARPHQVPRRAGVAGVRPPRLRAARSAQRPPRCAPRRPARRAAGTSRGPRR